MAKAPKFYAVRRGYQTGIFSSWAVAEPLVKGFKGANFKSFPTRGEAETFFNVSGTSAVLPVPATTTRGRNCADLLAKKLEQLPVGSILLYTDGGCDGNMNVATNRNQPAGWGVVALQIIDEPPRVKVVVELWGPVELNSSSTFYLGAEVASNNTGELSGIAEALLWVEERGGDEDVCVVYDSEYAANICQGKWKAHKNVNLARECKTIHGRVKQQRRGRISFLHVKGHSGDKWNDRADSLVQRGKTGSRCFLGSTRATVQVTTNHDSGAATLVGGRAGAPRQMLPHKRTASGLSSVGHDDDDDECTAFARVTASRRREAKQAAVDLTAEPSAAAAEKRQRVEIIDLT